MQCLSRSQLNDLKIDVSNQSYNPVFLKVKRDYRHITQECLIGLISKSSGTGSHERKHDQSHVYSIQELITLFPGISFRLLDFRLKSKPIQADIPNAYNVILHVSSNNIVYILSKKQGNPECFNIFFNNTEFKSNSICHPKASPLELPEYILRSPGTNTIASPLKLLEMDQHISRSPGMKTRIRRSWKGMKDAVRRLLRIKPTKSKAPFKIQPGLSSYRQNVIPTLKRRILTPIKHDELIPHTVNQTLLDFNLGLVAKNLGYILPIVLSLPESLHLNNKENYGLIDVKGDGWCGYYALGLVHFLNAGVLAQSKDMYEIILNMYSDGKPKHHLLDQQEFAYYCAQARINVAMFTLETQFGIEYYNLRAVYYNENNFTWVFPVLIQNGHYCILCKKKNTSCQIGFQKNDAVAILGNIEIPESGIFDIEAYQAEIEHVFINAPGQFQQKLHEVKSVLDITHDHDTKAETLYVITRITTWQPTQTQYIIRHTLNIIITDADLTRYNQYYKLAFKNLTCTAVFIKNINGFVLLWNKMKNTLSMGTPVHDLNRPRFEKRDRPCETMSDLCERLLYE